LLDAAPRGCPAKIRGPRRRLSVETPEGDPLGRRQGERKTFLTPIRENVRRCAVIWGAQMRRQCSARWFLPCASKRLLETVAFSN